MSYVLNIYKDGETLISEFEFSPVTDANIISRVPFTTLEDAQNAKSVYQVTMLRCNEDESAVLREIVNTQAEIIRKQRRESDELRNVINGFRIAIKRILNRVALMVTLTMTHREKSARLRDIATQIDDLLRAPHSDFSRIVPDDDIPF